MSLTRHLPQLGPERGERGGGGDLLEDELGAQGVVGICDLDTRALTRHLRERGAMLLLSGVNNTLADPVSPTLPQVRHTAGGP